MALREILAKFGFELEKGKAQEANALIDSFKGKLADVGKALAVGFVFDKGKQLIGELVDAGDQITDMSAQLGVSRQEFQAWSAAAGLGGASAEDFAASVKILEKNIGSAIAQPTGDTGKAFKKLGVDLKDSAGQVRPVLDVLRDTGLNVQTLGSESEQSAALLNLFGKGGLKLGPIFKDGAEGVEQLLAKMQELSLSEGTLDQLDAVGDATFLLEKQWLKTKAQLVGFALPGIQAAIGVLQKFVAYIGGSERAAHLAKTAFVVLGAVVGALAVELLLPWLPFIAAVTAAVLVVDELTRAFEGQPTVLEDIGNAASEAAQAIEGGFRAAGAAISGSFAAAGRSVATFFKNLQKWFGSGAGSAVKWLNGLWQGVTSWFSGKVAEFQQFGADLINGAIAGIKSAAGAVVEAIKAPFVDASNLLDTLFDRNSPSGYFERFTMDLGLGGIEGFRRIAPQVQNASERTFANLAPDPQVFEPQAFEGGNVYRTASVQQQNHNTFHVSSPAAGLRNAVAAGVSDASSLDRDALLADLEATA